MHAAAWLALGLAVLPGLSRAAEEVPRAETVIFDLDRRIEAPAAFNPFADGALRLHGAHQAMWEPLFVVDWATGALTPWLATAVETGPVAEDGSAVLTLRLRDGVLWSDGMPFGAGDVALSMELALASGRGALAARRDEVLSVEATGPLTVAIRLARPDPRFALDTLAVRVFGGLVVLPAHLWSGQDAATFAFDPPVGTGPYVFAGATDEMAVWDRDEDWWGARTGFRDLPAPRRLVWLHSGSEEARAGRLADGTLDAAHPVSAQTFLDIRAANPAIRAWRDAPPWGATDLCPMQMEFNTAAPPWDDPLLRRALSKALDREALADAVGGTPSPTMFAELGPMAPYVEAVRAAGLALSPIADTELAMRLMRDAGWDRGPDGAWRKDDAPLEARIAVDAASSADFRLADAVAAQLVRFGIAAEAEPVTSRSFWAERLGLGRFGLAITWLSCGSVADPLASLSRYLPDRADPPGLPARGTDNLARWRGADAEAYAGVVARIADRAPGAADLPALVAEAYAPLDRAMPFAPLVQTVRIVPVSTGRWTGWPTEEDPYGHPFFWWGDTHRILHALRPVPPSPFLSRTAPATAPPDLGPALFGPPPPGIRPVPRLARSEPVAPRRPAETAPRRPTPFLQAPRPAPDR